MPKSFVACISRIGSEIADSRSVTLGTTEGITCGIKTGIFMLG